jgi:hypothetical protein
MAAAGIAAVVTAVGPGAATNLTVRKLTACCHYGSAMSTDGPLWICTLLFAAAMLILSAMRHAEAAEAAADAASDDGVTDEAYRSAASGVDLGRGWTLGGDGGSGRGG